MQSRFTYPDSEQLMFGERSYTTGSAHPPSLVLTAFSSAHQHQSKVLRQIFWRRGPSIFEARMTFWNWSEKTRSRVLRSDKVASARRFRNRKNSCKQSKIFWAAPSINRVKRVPNSSLARLRKCARLIGICPQGYVLIDFIHLASCRNCVRSESAPPWGLSAQLKFLRFSRVMK